MNAGRVDYATTGGRGTVRGCERHGRRRSAPEMGRSATQTANQAFAAQTAQTFTDGNSTRNPLCLADALSSRGSRLTTGDGSACPTGAGSACLDGAGPVSPDWPQPTTQQQEPCEQKNQQQPGRDQTSGVHGDGPFVAAGFAAKQIE